MTVVYIGAFITGLLIAVGIMLFGIERKPTSGSDSTTNTVRHWLPLFAAFAAAFGIAGYSLSKVLPGSGALVAGVAVGLLVALLTAWVVAKSASMPVEHDVDDERYVLQGHVARVVTCIQAGREGEISFDYGDERRTLRARSLDDASVDVGTEVVIERIEGDLAFVEPWLQVEQRL